MTHISRIVKVHKPASGLLAVTVRCCDDSKTDAVLTIHGLHRSDEEILADIQTHQKRIEELHHHDGRAEELLKTLGARVKDDCGCK